MVIELSEMLTIASILLAVLGLFANFLQIRRGNTQKRAEYIVQLYNEFVNDRDMMEIYYKLEYSKFNYGQNFHGSETEKQLDKLLGHFSNIGRLHFMGVIRRQDLKFLEYEFLVIYQNSNIESYLAFLDEWFETRGIDDQKFEYFRKTAQLLEHENQTP